MKRARKKDAGSIEGGLFGGRDLMGRVLARGWARLKAGVI